MPDRELTIVELLEAVSFALNKVRNTKLRGCPHGFKDTYELAAEVDSHIGAAQASSTPEERELFAAATKTDLAAAIEHLRNWMSHIDDHHRRKYADLIEAQAKLIAWFVNNRSGSAHRDKINSAFTSEAIPALSSVTSTDPCPYCSHEMRGALDCENCGNSYRYHATGLPAGGDKGAR